MPKPIWKAVALLAVLTLLVPATALAEPRVLTAAAELAEPSGEGTALLDEAWRIVQERFYDRNLHGLDWAAVGRRYRGEAAGATDPAARSAVINRMLQELGASHTRHYTKAEPAYYELLDIFAGGLRRELPRLFPGGEVAYEGIGVVTRDIDGRRYIAGVYQGLPAERAGLKLGDEILAADGGPFEAVGSFAGKSGQPVGLTVRRSRDGAPERVAVTPERIRPGPAFLAAMEASARLIELDGRQIGYVRIWSYAGGQYQQLLEQLVSTGKLKDADALVWDLRDGWGGAQPHYLDLFNGRGPVMTVIGRGEEPGLRNPRWRKPVAMLINEGTRSGKEILAFGFRSYGFGEIVGSRSSGAVLAGRAFLLSDDSLLLVAVADVLVDGKRLEAVGVEPTIEVPFRIEYAGGDDPQLDRALGLLGRGR